MSSPAEDPRRLLLDGVHNLRHVGGYPTETGGQTRPEVLFRSDSLHRLSPAGGQALLDRGLRTVIDLRRPRERAEAPNRLAGGAGIRTCEHPLYERRPQELNEGRPVPDLATLYRVILDRAQPGLSAVFACLARPDALPALILCTAGKDRTGLVVALCLKLAGVPEAHIVADYARSRAYLEPLMPGFRATWERLGVVPAVYEPFLETPPAAMTLALHHLEARYGGARAYLRRLGLSEADLDRLATGLTTGPEPGPGS